MVTTKNSKISAQAGKTQASFKGNIEEI